MSASRYAPDHAEHIVVSALIKKPSVQVKTIPLSVGVSWSIDTPSPHPVLAQEPLFQLYIIRIKQHLICSTAVS